MSITSIGGDASQQWQALRASRADKPAGSAATSAANLPPPPRGPTPAAPDPSAAVDASGNPAAAGGISSASAKVISDLKALFISLQSGAAGTSGATPAAPAAAAADAATGAAGTTSVQSDLKTLFGDLAKVSGATVSGHHGGHHSHRAPAAGGPVSSDAATGAPADLAATAGQPAPKRSGGVLDELVGALKAYAASSNGNSAKAATGLNA